MLFIQFLWKNPEFYFSWVIIVCFSICVHECSHAIAAFKRGDSTACESGYLTINPIQIMSPYAMAALALVGLAWASVPVNKSKLRGRADTAIISFAGPGTNLVLGIMFALLAAVAKVFGGGDDGGVAASFVFVFRVGAEANAFLFLLNVLPVPFLDGWDVLTYFVPQARRLDEQKQGYITLGVLIGLFFLGGFAVLFTIADVFRAVTMGFFLALFGAGG